MGSAQYFKGRGTNGLLAVAWQREEQMAINCPFPREPLKSDTANLRFGNVARVATIEMAHSMAYGICQRRRARANLLNGHFTRLACPLALT